MKGLIMCAWLYSCLLQQNSWYLSVSHQYRTWQLAGHRLLDGEWVGYHGNECSSVLYIHTPAIIFLLALLIFPCNDNSTTAQVWPLAVHDLPWGSASQSTHKSRPRPPNQHHTVYRGNHASKLFIVKVVANFLTDHSLQYSNTMLLTLAHLFSCFVHITLESPQLREGYSYVGELDGKLVIDGFLDITGTSVLDNGDLWGRYSDHDHTITIERILNIKRARSIFIMSNNFVRHSVVIEV